VETSSSRIRTVFFFIFSRIKCFTNIKKSSTFGE
jgi:hypothetical protein